jgi:hypothetical protein
MAVLLIEDEHRGGPKIEGDGVYGGVGAMVIGGASRRRGRRTGHQQNEHEQQTIQNSTTRLAVRIGSAAKNLAENTGLESCFQDFFRFSRRDGSAKRGMVRDKKAPLEKNAGRKKTPLGTVWVAPAEFKEAMQLPAQHRQLQLPGLRGGKTELAAKP